MGDGSSPKILKEIGHMTRALMGLKGRSCETVIGSWRMVIGDWRLEIGNWKLETDN